jgi:hypothetical protein
MPLTVNRKSSMAGRLRAAIAIRKQIDQLERKFARVLGKTPRYVLMRNVYGFNAREMKKIAQKLHAKAKEGIASGRSKEFRGSIEEAL